MQKKFSAVDTSYLVILLLFSLMWLYSYGPKKRFVLDNTVFEVTKEFGGPTELHLTSEKYSFTIHLKFYKTFPGLMAKIILS